MLDLKMPKLIQIYQVKKGKIHYVCSCGRLATLPIQQYKKHSRCKNCVVTNTDLKNSNNFSGVEELEYQELFDKFYNNGLLDFVEARNGY